MDFDPRDDRLGPMKLARTDSFPLKMQITSNGALGSLVRSNSMVSDGRLGCSPTNSTASDGALLGGGDSSNFMSESRLMRSDSMVSYPTGTSRAISYHNQASFPFRTSAATLPLSMGRDMTGHYVLPESEAMVFTASQLRELQHHALIFKYLMCGVNVPPELVHPIRTSVAALAAGLSPGAHHFASWWGNYHLGYANSTDPEPGRCRRTDGKKWRCSRDVVPDQKYCERHMHRGRHRARKPPENVNNSNSGANNTANANTATANNITTNINGNSATPAATSTLTSASSAAASPSSSAVSLAAARAAAVNPNVSSNNGLRAALTLQQQQQQQQQRPPSSGLGIRNLSGTSSPTGGLSIGSQFNQLGSLSAKDLRYFHGDMSQEQTLFSDTSGNIRGLSQESPALSGLSVISSAVNNPLRVMQSKQQQQQQHSFLGGGVAFEVGGGAGRESESCQPLRHFFDDWPRSGRDPTSLPWSDVDHDDGGGASNRSSSTTQLSISIPPAAPDFASANPGSPRGKLALSPLKLSMASRCDQDDPSLRVDPTQMGLGVGPNPTTSHHHQQQAHQSSSWIPIAWESPVGGPLAEVLQSSSNTPRGGSASCKLSSGLNLMTDAWDSAASPPSRADASSSPPSGLLNASSFSQHSSTATSPRAAGDHASNTLPLAAL